MGCNSIALRNIAEPSIALRSIGEPSIALRSIGEPSIALRGIGEPSITCFAACMELHQLILNIYAVVGEKGEMSCDVLYRA